MVWGRKEKFRTDKMKNRNLITDCIKVIEQKNKSEKKPLNLITCLGGIIYALVG